MTGVRVPAPPSFWDEPPPDGAHRADSRTGPARPPILSAGAVAGLAATAILGLGGGIAVGTAGDTLGIGLALLGVGVVAGLVVILFRPLWAVALVFASPAVGDRDLPSAPYGVQLVHAVSVLAIGVVTLSLLANGSASRIRRPEIRLPLLFATALTLTACASTLLSINVGKSAKVTATFALGLLLVLAVVIVARTGAKQRVLLGAAVLGSLAVTMPVLGSADQLVASYGGAVVDNRAVATFVDPNALGSYSAMVLFLAIGWRVAAKNRWERLGAVVGGLAAAAALTLTLSRGAWIGTLAGLVVFGILHPRARRPLLLATVATMTGGLLFFVAAPGIGGPAAVVVDRVVSIGSPAANPYDVRPITWGEAVRQYAREPVLGNGPGAFSVLSAESPSALQFQPRRHAHNGLLTTAAEMGTVGLFSGLGLVISLALAIWGRVRRLQAAHRYSELGLLAGGASALVALSVHLFVDYPLRNPVLMVFVWTVAGLMLAVAATPSAPRISSGAGAGRALATYAARPR